MRRGALGVLIAAALVAAGCGADDDGGDPLTVGSTGDPAMRVVAQIYAGALRSAGESVDEEPVTAGYEELLADAGGAVDLFPALGATLLAQLAPHLTPISAEDVYTDLNRSLPQGISVADPTMVDVSWRLLVNRESAEAAGVTDLSGCDRLPDGLPVAVTVDPAPEVLAAYGAAGCRLGPIEVLADPTAVYRAVADGRAVGLLDGLAAAAADPDDRVEVLAAADDSPAGPPAEQLLAVYATAELSEDGLKAINKVAGELTTADLVELADRVGESGDARRAADDWLSEHGF